ncbi:hypothetical protein BC830DRAFT_1152383 [Chytriomyces sp. MP71]|nr:hypothetical protein BC830DRAFT_1152383 [Chytriomyces sp. MP71]
MSEPTLENLPPEILYRIPVYLTCSNMVRLGHAVRFFRHISSSITSVGDMVKQRSCFWPNPLISLLESSESLKAHLELVHRCGGTVRWWPHLVPGPLELIPSNMPMEAHINIQDAMQCLKWLVDAGVAVTSLIFWGSGFKRWHSERVVTLLQHIRRVLKVTLEYHSVVLPETVLRAIMALNGLRIVELEMWRSPTVSRDTLILIPCHLQLRLLYRKNYSTNVNIKPLIEALDVIQLVDFVITPVDTSASTELIQCLQGLSTETAEREWAYNIMAKGRFGQVAFTKL